MVGRSQSSLSQATRRATTDVAFVRSQLIPRRAHAPIDHHRHRPLDDAAAHRIALLFPLVIVADPVPLRLQIPDRGGERFEGRMAFLLRLPLLQERASRFDLSLPQPIPKPLEVLTNPGRTRLPKPSDRPHGFGNGAPEKCLCVSVLIHSAPSAMTTCSCGPILNW